MLLNRIQSKDWGMATNKIVGQIFQTIGHDICQIFYISVYPTNLPTKCVNHDMLGPTRRDFQHLNPETF